MKRITLIILGIIMFLPTSVQAKGLDEKDILICKYENIVNNAKYHTIEIYYDSIKDSFYALAPETFKFNSNKVHIFTTDIRYNLERKFMCPKYAFKDTSFFNEICFDNDNTTCLSVDDFGTEFKGTSKITYDLISSFSNLFASYTYNPEYSSTEELIDIIRNKMEQEIRNALDQYIYNSPAYINAPVKDAYLQKMRNSNAYITKLQKEMESFNNKAQEYVTSQREEINNNQNLTDEERKEANIICDELETAINIANETIKSLTYTINPGIPIGSGNNCEGFLGYDEPGYPLYYLKIVYNIMKYASVVIFIIMTIIDCLKAVASSNEDAMKKATQHAIKRGIIVVVLFLLPILINFVLNIFGISSGTCGVG